MNLGVGKGTPFSRSPSSPVKSDTVCPVLGSGTGGRVPVKPLPLDVENVFPSRTSPVVAFPVGSSPKSGTTTTLFWAATGPVITNVASIRKVKSSAMGFAALSTPFPWFYRIVMALAFSTGSKPD